MILSFEARVVLKVEHQPGIQESKHIHTKINLEVSRNLDGSQYLDKEDLPTATGVKSITNVLVHGLLANLRYGHEKGYWNEAEHIRFMIEELQRGFVAITKTDVSTS